MDRDYLWAMVLIIAVSVVCLVGLVSLADESPFARPPSAATRGCEP